MSYLLDLKRGELDPCEFQKELFDEIARFKGRIRHLSRYIQNDFKRQIEDGFINEERIEFEIGEMNEEYEESLEQFREINVKMNAIMNFYIKK